MRTQHHSGIATPCPPWGRAARPRPLLALSNGELHRLLLARALLLEPQLLVVDDPFAGLDAATRARLTELLARLPDEGTAVLHVAARDQDVPEDVTHELELGAGAVVGAGPRRSPRRATPSRGRAGGGEAGATGPTSNPSPDPPRAETVLELRGLTVRHRDLTLLADVDWTIRAGERWGLVGPNGAGKSTLLNVVLADHPQAHASDVVVCGRRLGPGTSVWDVKRCLGWVSPELDAHYPVGTPALDVVVSGFRASLGVYHAPTDEERGAAAAWLERLGLSDRAAIAFDAISRCERRLLLLARPQHRQRKATQINGSHLHTISTVMAIIGDQQGILPACEIDVDVGQQLGVEQGAVQRTARVVYAQAVAQGVE